MSSKLFTEVREKRGLVYTVKTDLDLGENYGYLIIYAGTEKSKVKEVIDICLKEFYKMRNLTKKELDEGKEQIIGNYHVGLENSDSTALNLILEEVSSSKGAESFYEYSKNIKKVSLVDIKKLAEKTDYSSFVLSP
jgi:zinc protease